VAEGAGRIFFAYIGFDSISTHAEEARRPQRDLAIGIMGALSICTILYIAVAAVLTGMVPYRQIDINAPLSAALQSRGLTFAGGLVTLGILAGMTSSLLVGNLSQPRILMAMARDGLLPQGTFAAVHPRFKTPWKATIIVGVVVAAAASLAPLGFLADLVSIGTLFAFVVVSAAVWILRITNPGAPRPFRAPWVPVVSTMGVLVNGGMMFSLGPENWTRLFVWLVIGLLIYFGYSRHHSVLARMDSR
jgi:APA family basic amino acid/polyamine antiporter